MQNKKLNSKQLSQQSVQGDPNASESKKLPQAQQIVQQLMSELNQDPFSNLDPKFRSEAKLSAKKDEISIASSQKSRKRDKKAAKKASSVISQSDQQINQGTQNDPIDLIKDENASGIKEALGK